jgi:hypothetical protein
LAIGIGLAANSPKQDDPKNGFELTSTRPVGSALLGVGGAALVTGIVLFVIDRKRQAQRTAIAPLWGPDFAGVSWSGRF